MRGGDFGDERLRDLAISKHDREAGAFEEEYGSRAKSGHRATAFLLGREKIDRLLADRLLTLSDGARVLDAGCGTGHQVADMVKAGFDAVGVEPSLEMRRRAKALNPGVEVVDGSVTDLPFDDASFDAVIALEVLRYLPRADNLAAFREIHRVLRPGGMIFLTMVNRWAIDGYVIWEGLLARRSLSDDGPNRAHCEFVTPGGARRDLVSHGFDGVETHGRLLLPLRWAYKIHLRLGRMVATVLDPVDNLLCRIPGTAGLAGHLVVVARAGEAAEG
ncbi:MAG TPA: hypothetical protein DGF10_00725 [Acidimicrobiaceae bacterium]|nr:hypothetical protein [Acidimicrobiaceae bacterium]